jgi:hypothetical protein
MYYIYIHAYRVLGIMYINTLIVTVSAAAAVFQSIHWFVNLRKLPTASTEYIIFYCQPLKKIQGIIIFFLEFLELQVLISS